MTTKISRYSRWLLVACLLISGGKLAHAAPSHGPSGTVTARSSMGRWEELDVPTVNGSRPRLYAATDAEGTLWILADGQLRYWDGKRFLPPVAGDEATRLHNPTLSFSHFVGGAGVNLYAIAHRHSTNARVEASVCQLVSGKVRYLSDFEYTPSNGKGLFSAKSGKLYHIDTDFLAVLTPTGWSRIAMPVSKSRPQALDTGSNVYFFSNYILYQANADDTWTRHELAPISERLSTDWLKAILGADRIVYVFTDGTRDKVQAFSLDTLQPVSDTSGFAAVQAQQQSLFRASDGSVWENNVDGSLLRRRDGQQQIYNWQNGFNFRYPWIYEDKSRHIFAVSHSEGVAMFHTDETQGPLPSQFALWQAFDAIHLMRDPGGYIWIRLKSHPGHISRWDGYAWKHIPLPAGVSSFDIQCADDRGHVLITIWRSRTKQTSWAYVSVRGVREHSSLREAVQSAVAAGAQRFEAMKYDDRMPVVVVDRQKQIWLAESIWPEIRPNELWHFDGRNWSQVKTPHKYFSLLRSEKYGVLIRNGSKFYAPSANGFLEVASLYEKENESPPCLLSRAGYQPFEAELLRRYPNTYIRVMPNPRDSRDFYLRQIPEETISFNALEWNYEKVERKRSAPWEKTPPALWGGDRLPYDTSKVTPDFHGGAWRPGSYPMRVFSDKVFPVEWFGTPLQGKGAINVTEDRAHNHWIETGYGEVYLQRLDKFRIRQKSLKTRADGAVEIEVDSDIAGLVPPNLRLFWRLRGGEWHTNQWTNYPASTTLSGLGKKLELNFPRADGRYEIEIIGMEPTGGISANTLDVTIKTRSDSVH